MEIRPTYFTNDHIQIHKDLQLVNVCEGLTFKKKLNGFKERGKNENPVQYTFIAEMCYKKFTDIYISN